MRNKPGVIWDAVSSQSLTLFVPLQTGLSQSHFYGHHVGVSWSSLFFLGVETLMLRALSVEENRDVLMNSVL